MAEGLGVDTDTTAGTPLSSPLESILMAEDVVPGARPSYELCKLIYMCHPLGDKIAASPIRMAQSQQRDIAVPDGPEDYCKDAFIESWKKDNFDNVALNVGTLARVYGISSLALLEKDKLPGQKLDWKKLAASEIAFNVLDPLNTSGSLTLSQDPNAMEFQKHRDIAVNGVTYDRSRTVTLLNENPIYIEYTPSAFGFVGRSIYQRALYPLKTFITTMRTDDMMARKAGIIVAKIKQPGSIANAVMTWFNAVKRNILRYSSTNDVISITPEEAIESLNLQNIDGVQNVARKNCLENVAAAVPMPAILINSETFGGDFHEGSEDAKHVAEYIDGIRSWLQPVYSFLDEVTMRRAWSPDFYKIIQTKFPESYGNVDYETAFYRWKNSFSAVWPSLLREPESKLVEVDKIRFETASATLELMVPLLDPKNKIELIKWFADALNDAKHLFPSPLVLDYDALEQFNEEQQALMDEQASMMAPPPGGDGDGPPEQGEDKEPRPPRPMAA